MAKKDVLDVDRPEQFLSRERVAQRLGALVLTLLIVSGALGAFGNGWLAQATTRADGVEVQHERFTRVTYRTAMQITVETPRGDGEPVRLFVDRGFLSRVSMLEVRPPQAQRRLDAHTAVFAVPAAGGRAHLELHYEPERPGAIEIRIGTDAGAEARVRQIVFF